MAVTIQNTAIKKWPLDEFHSITSPITAGMGTVTVLYCTL